MHLMKIGLLCLSAFAGSYVATTLHHSLSPIGVVHAEDNPAPSSLVASSLTIVDSAGTKRIVLEAKPETSVISLNDNTGRPIAALWANANCAHLEFGNSRKPGDGAAFVVNITDGNASLYLRSIEHRSESLIYANNNGVQHAIKVEAGQGEGAIFTRALLGADAQGGYVYAAGPGALDGSKKPPSFAAGYNRDTKRVEAALFESGEKPAWRAP